MATGMETAASLRAARERAVSDRGLRGSEFGRALAEICDAALRDAAASIDLRGRWALAAVGSYARRELCPGSDVDVVLLHDGAARGADGARAARSLWYPFWDAGFVLGHAVRTPREALALASDGMDALTALLDLRTVVGDHELVADVERRARQLVQRRRDRVLDRLARASAARHTRPGPIAEVLEPNLKDGAGGLRDLQALAWGGWATGPPGGLEGLVAAGALGPGDPDVLAAAAEHLLDLRVALHRTTGGRSDTLLLQDQDAVAATLGVASADDLMRALASTARQVSWIASDVWSRLDPSRRPSGRVAHGDHRLDDGVVLRDGRVALLAAAPVTMATVLRVAAAAAHRRAPIDRPTLERIASAGADGGSAWRWDDAARDAFFALLRAGHAAVPVFEALDHVGVLLALVPEWEHARARPQRNAYHRYTVDRHLLEAVAECAALLDDDGFDGAIARRTRPELLLLGALLHDIAKGVPGDHSEVGATTAMAFAQRIGLDPHGTRVLGWLVRHHLSLADTATRRDLTDEDTIVRFGRLVGDTERLDLLYALTIGDARATGPAAWSAGKAALCRQLFTATDALLERGVVGPGLDAARAEALARCRGLLDAGEVAIEWTDRADGLLECTVVAPDRRGLLATVAGVLTLVGFDVQSAAIYGDPQTGMALEVYRGIDRFERLDDTGRREVATMLRGALDGALSVRTRLAERIQRYRRRLPSDPSRGVTIRIDLDASASATVVEVHAPDEVGLLASVAEVFSDLGFDVTAALVSTAAEQVVDVFYVRDVNGAKPTDPLTLARLRATLVARLTREFVLPSPGGATVGGAPGGDPRGAE